MATDREWVAGEIGRWLTNDEHLYRECVSRARKSLSKSELTGHIKRFVTHLYENMGVRLGEVTLTEMRSLRLAEWSGIADLFEDDAPWSKGERP